MRKQPFPIFASLALALLAACGKPEPPPSSLANPPLPSPVEIALAAAATAENDLALDTWRAAREGDIEGLKKGLSGGIDVNGTARQGGGTLLMDAAIHGQLETAALLIEKGADLNLKNSQGATALHSAAFFCRPELAALLLTKGAEVNAMNNRGKTPLDAVEEPWDAGLAGYYTIVYNGLKLRLDIENVKTVRPEIAAILRAKGGKSGDNP